MTERTVSLEFECCDCQEPVGVTLKCEGEGLAKGLRSVVSAKVPCPHCGSINTLAFEPVGTLRGVSANSRPRPMPEPSLN